MNLFIGNEQHRYLHILSEAYLRKINFTLSQFLELMNKHKKNMQRAKYNPTK